MVPDPQIDTGRTARGFLRRLLGRAASDREVRREGAVIAIASGKGGTGKSFLTTNLAIALHRQGHRVAVVDCDFGLANAHLLFGANPRWSMQHLLGGQRSVQEVMVSTTLGPSLIAGGSGIASLAELDARHMQMLARALGWIAEHHDFVLLDCAAGLAPQSMITVLAAQNVVMVTNPEIAALTDAYAVIKCLARQGGHPEVDLVVNRVGAAGLGAATFERLADVSLRFAGVPIHYLGEVPEDPAVSHRRLGQAPILVGLPTCDTSMAILGLLANLWKRIGARDRNERGVEVRMLEQIRRW